MLKSAHDDGNVAVIESIIRRLAMSTLIIHYVSESETLKELYNGSALTLEGLSVDEKSLRQYEEWLKTEGGGLKDNDRIEFFVVSGRLMNDEYGTDYPNDLNLVCVGLDGLSNLGRIACKRFTIGARWFDDIVPDVDA